MEVSLVASVAVAAPALAGSRVVKKAAVKVTASTVARVMEKVVLRIHHHHYRLHHPCLRFHRSLRRRILE
jgi:hypothetical protein